MGTSLEIRDKVGALLWRDQWLRRFVTLAVMFGVMRYLAVNLSVSLMGPSVPKIVDRLMNVASPQELAGLFKDPAFVRPLALLWLLSTFVGMVVDAMMWFGLAKVRLGVVRGRKNEGKWHEGAFSGLRDPFGLFALAALEAVFVFWPLALAALAAAIFREAAAAIPAAAIFCAVAFYRYRQAWLVKADNPSKPALKCLRESAALMRGNKRKCFLLDCAYWRPVTMFLCSVLVTTVAMFAGAPSMIMFLLAISVAAQSLYLQACIPLGQAIFYDRLTVDTAGKGAEHDQG